MRRVLLIVVGLMALLGLPLLALAQSSPDEQKSFFLNFVQDRLSTPDRQISISNIDGALSSRATIREITVSDRKGVYLKIDDIALDWNQAAIFTGRLEVNSLTAKSIDYLRNPVPTPGATSLPSPEAHGLEVPQLPVAVVIKKLSVPSITFGDQVFGLGSKISLDGNVTLDGGSLDSSLDIQRLDGPGGSLALKAKYDKASTKLDLDLGLTEPRDGIVATLLNIAGRPDIKLAIKGAGPVASLSTTLTLDAGGQRALTGTAKISHPAQGFLIDAALHGPISSLMAPAYRDFFGADSRLSATALLRNGGGLDLTSLHLDGGQLNLTGTAGTSADGFLDDLHLKGTIADPGGKAVVLPVPGATTRIDNGTLSLDFGGGSQNWQARLAVNGFSNATLSATALTITGNGVGADLDNPAKRRLTFNVDGLVHGVTSTDPNVADALGSELGIGAAGLWNAGEPIQLAQFRLAGKAVSANASGTIANGVFNGKLGLTASSLAPFSGLADRNLGGAVALAATGTVSPLSAGFDLDVDGTATNLHLDAGAADRVLAGTVRLTGGIARTAKGITARTFKLANDKVQLSADGTFASTAADFRFGFDLSDLALLSPQARGALSVTGTAKGTDSNIALSLSGTVPKGALLERPLEAASVGFTGSLVKGALNGTVKGAASLGGSPVTLNSSLSVANDIARFSGLNFVAGGTSFNGDLSRGKDGLFEGKLHLASTDVSTAAALALITATGEANADIALTAQGGKQAVDIAATAQNLSAAALRIGDATVKANIADLFGVPVIQGSVDGKDVAAGGVAATTLALQATSRGQGTAFTATAALKTGAQLAAAGALTPLAGGYRLALDRVELSQGKLSARLAAPAAITVAGGKVALDAVRFDVGGGSVTASGSAGDNLDVTLGIKALPLSAADAVMPGLGLGGTIDGSAHITGSAAAPTAQFRLTGARVVAAAIANYGITPLQFTANGDYANQVLHLASLSAQSPAGLRVTAKGTVPASLHGLDLTVDGAAPLALANRFVADRGGQATGTASLSARITGSAADPRLTGKLSVSNGSYTDPALNLKLVRIAGAATLAGDRITLDRLTAGLSTGGSIAADGTVSLRAPDFNADLKVRLNHARYVDQDLVVATASAALTLTGPLGRGPLLGGTVNVEKADITVPEQIGGGAADIKVKHIDPPRAVAASLARARADAQSQNGAHGPSSVLRLDLRVSAPNQVFIRGRGLDAEMGGAVRLTGSINDIRPVGALNLIRGRLEILGQRVTFTSGSVTLTGSLDPQIALSGTVPGDGITATVTVSGQASDPKIDFSSTPALPPDEVLSRLLFKQGLNQLSPLQLARLAAAASALAGGSGSSLLDSLRSTVGLDNLDIITDAQGNTAVQAGRYITDNVYLGVQAGANGESKATINLDITPDLKANASSGTDGNSSVGLFYERDY